MGGLGGCLNFHLCQKTHVLLQPKGSHTRNKWLKYKGFGICRLQVCHRDCMQHAGILSVKWQTCYLYSVAYVSIKLHAVIV